ncbi:MAG: DNA polymerase III subunit beta [Sediminibacterium sp.]|nr:DNA polymerase III subunit beta [Sediminibacterium sp.]
MNFIVSSSILLKNVQLISGVVVSHTVLPILENFLFSVEDKTLKITATDLETTMIVQIPVESKEDFKCCIPSKLLIESLKNLPDQPITFTINEDNMIEFTSDTGKYKFMGESADEFPKEIEMFKENQTEIHSTNLLEAIQYTLFCVGSDENRPAMTGVHIELESNQINFVSTDAQRLSLFSIKNMEIENEKSAITVPKKPLAQLKGILPQLNEEIKISFSDKNLFIETSNFKLYTRLIDAPFPEYRVVLPKENQFKLLVNKSNFSQALKRIMVFSNKSTNLISLSISSNSLVLETEDSDFNNGGKEVLECSFEGEDLKIGFNGKQFLESILAIQNEFVLIEISNPRKGVIIKPSEQLENEELLLLALPLALDI